MLKFVEKGNECVCVFETSAVKLKKKDAKKEEEK